MFISIYNTLAIINILLLYNRPIALYLPKLALL